MLSANAVPCIGSSQGDWIQTSVSLFVGYGRGRGSALLRLPYEGTGSLVDPDVLVCIGWPRQRNESWVDEGSFIPDWPSTLHSTALALGFSPKVSLAPIDLPSRLALQYCKVDSGS